MGRRDRPGEGAGRREAHLSTEPACAQTAPRLPRPHEDQRGPPHLVTQAGEGAEAPVGLRPVSGLMAARPMADKDVHLLTLERLKRRPDFLRAAQARSAATPGLVLQAARTPEGAIEHAEHTLRVGFTVSRKVGTAVARNRARRRLKEAARLVLARTGKPGHDYVLVGRRETINRPFALLIADLEEALARVHATAAKGRAPRERHTEKRP